MFLVCVVCHEIVDEIEPLLNFEIKHTFCEECHHKATVEYINMFNEFYFEEQEILKINSDKS